MIMKRLNLILAMLFALAVFLLLTQPSFVIANGDSYLSDYIPSEGSYSIDGEWYPFIYGYTWVGNLTYHPATADFPRAYITSDHDFYCHHYYEDEDFDVEYEPFLTVDEDHQFSSNIYIDINLGEYDPETQAMPEDYLSDKGTVWVNVTDLPAAEAGTDYTMFAYSRMRATHAPRADDLWFRWKSLESSVSFTHRRPPQ